MVALNERAIYDYEMIDRQLDSHPHFSDVQHKPKPKPLSYNGVKEYFWAQGNLRRLVGASTRRFLFGAAYSALGISNP
jgi:hypothetical protein